MYFSTINASIINAVNIYPAAAGLLNVTLKNAGGTTISTYSTTIAAGDISNTIPKTIPLNFSIPAGSTGWTINYDIALYRGSGTYAYPYTSNGFSITGNTFDGNNVIGGTRYYFYNWNVTSISNCAPARTQVTATVTPAPSITASVSAALVCGGTPTNLNVTSTNDPNYTYTWAPGTLTGAAQTVSPTATTTYVVNAIDNTAGTYAGCTATANVLVTVNPTPTITAAVTAATICAGTPTSLSSVGTGSYTSVVVAENFNGGTYPGWTATDAPTSPLISNWIIPSAPFNDASGSATFTNFTTVNGGGFAYANADAGGSGTTTNTILNSAVFSTTNATSSIVTFENLFRYYSFGDIKAAVEITSNGGSTWTVLKDYVSLAANQGGVINNAQSTVNESISIPVAFLNQPTVRLRFNYVSSFGFFWIIDNVKVTNTLPDNITWTSTPSGFTSSVQNPGAVSPIVSTTYTATITNPITGCNSSSTVAVIVNPLPTASVSNNGTQCQGSDAVFTLTGTANAIVTYNINGAANTTATLDAAGIATVTITAPAVNQTLNLVSATSAAPASCPKILGMSSTVVVTLTGTWYGITADWHLGSNWYCFSYSLCKTVRNSNLHLHFYFWCRLFKFSI